MNPPAVVEGRAFWTYAGLAAWLAVLWLALLPLRPLFNPDEGRYAEIPREMLAGGDWVIPHLNGLAYIEKPPLQYWSTALGLAVFGAAEFGARVYTALCALGTLGVVWVAARALWLSAAAWRAAAVLASMLLFVVLGQLLTLDMSLTLFMTVSWGAFLLAQRAAPPGGGHPAAERWWMWVAWAAAALGVLTKGPVAAAIPAAVLLLYSLVARDFSPWRRLHAAVGAPLFLAITVPWHWLAAERLPDFLQFYFVHEHVARYLTPSADREEAWWFFAAVLALGSMPWTLSALRVLALGWRRGPRTEFDARLFLWIWVVFVCVFFSLSDSKLIPYILPALPALALLIGSSATQAWRRDVWLTALLTLLAAMLLAAASRFGPGLLAPTARTAYFAALAKPLVEIAALLFVSAVFVLLRHRRDVTQATVFLGVGWCLSGLLLMRAAAAVAPLYSGVVLARALEAPAQDVPIYMLETYDQTLPFYWRHTVIPVAYRGELDFGLRHDATAAIPSVAAFVTVWRGLEHGYAVMQRSRFEALATEGVPMHEIGRDLQRVLVRR